MELKKYSDFRNNESADKFVMSGRDNDLELEEVVWAVFPKDDNIRPLKVIIDLMRMTLKLQSLTINEMESLKLKNSDGIVNSYNFDRSMTFDSDGTYHVVGVDKIKLFSNVIDAREFVEAKTDADFIRREGHYYILSLREARGIIAKALGVNSKLIQLEIQ